MIAALQLKYNRGRQASITNDLVDIITGKPANSHRVISVWLLIFVKRSVLQVPMRCSFVPVCVLT